MFKDEILWGLKFPERKWQGTKFWLWNVLPPFHFLLRPLCNVCKYVDWLGQQFPFGLIALLPLLVQGVVEGDDEYRWAKNIHWNTHEIRVEIKNNNDHNNSDHSWTFRRTDGGKTGCRTLYSLLSPTSQLLLGFFVRYNCVCMYVCMYVCVVSSHYPGVR